MMLIGIFRIAWLVLSTAATLAVATGASATAFSTDASDVYVSGDEDGWGVELAQRGDVIFATIYTYDANNRPTFFTAALFFAGIDAAGKAVWSGDLIVTQGPWFGAPYDKSKVLRTKAGTATYVPESGLLTYTVDGVAVTKQMTRLPFRFDSYVGTYKGTYKLVASGCSNSSDNGTFYIDAIFTVTQGANSLNVVTNEADGTSCTLSGDYSQFGQFGQSRGTFSCTNGFNGNNLFFEMNVTPTDFRGRITQSDNHGCSVTGSLAGVRQ